MIPFVDLLGAATGSGGAPSADSLSASVNPNLIGTVNITRAAQPIEATSLVPVVISGAVFVSLGLLGWMLYRR